MKSLSYWHSVYTACCIGETYSEGVMPKESGQPMSTVVDFCYKRYVTFHADDHVLASKK